MASKVLGSRERDGRRGVCNGSRHFHFTFWHLLGACVCLRTPAACLFGPSMLLFLLLSALAFFRQKYLANLVGPASGLLISAGWHLISYTQRTQIYDTDLFGIVRWNLFVLRVDLLLWRAALADWTVAIERRATTVSKSDPAN